MLYDLAIALNDWCSQEDGSLDSKRAGAARCLCRLAALYRSGSRTVAGHAMRIACVRFWLSRLIAAESFAGQEVLIHDPDEFQRRLAQRQQVELALPFAF